MVRRMQQEGTLQNRAIHLRDEARINAWADTSRRTYTSAYNSWLYFCEVVGVEPEGMTNSVPWLIDQMAEVIVQYVAVQCGVRGMSPDSIKQTYLPGIAASFAMRRIPNNFKAASKIGELHSILKGFKRLYAKSNPAANSLKLAFGMDLALSAVGVMRVRRTFAIVGRCETIVRAMQFRIFVVMAVGIFFMLRRSEHIVAKGGAGPSPLTRRHVVFFDQEDMRIPYEEVGMRRARKVMLNVEFSKTDHSGFGRRTYHVRQIERPEVCIVNVMESWVKTSRDRFGAKESDPFYHLPGVPDVTLLALHQVMAETVSSHGVDGESAKATSHSLRYGGATMLAAAGFPQYLIAHYGGWAENSASLKRYARPSEESISMVSEYMSRVTLSSPSRHYIQDMILRHRSQKK
jgi:hypothetical protein